MAMTTRFPTVAMAVLIGLAIDVELAAADSGSLPGGAMITWNRFFITENGSVVEPSTPDARRRYFNLAHCVCSQGRHGDEHSFDYELGITGITGTRRPAEVWVGTQCDDDLVRNMMCRRLDTTIADIDALVVPTRITLNTYDVINGVNNDMPCQQRAGDAFAWLLVDHDGDNVYDYFANRSVGSSPDVMSGIDTEPPPLPTNFRAEPGEESITISWTPATGRADDIFYFQALCTKADDTKVADTAPFRAQYQTTDDVCGVPQQLDLLASDIDSEDGGDPMTAPPAAFASLDPAFLCGDQSSGRATSMTIRGLENGEPYKIALLAIDFYGNVTGTYFTRTVTPKPVTDFWEDLNDRNGGIEGGCLLAQTYGDGNPLTRTLRDFRDHTLARSAPGRALAAAYYATLGRLGGLVEGSPAARVIAAVALAPLVALALLWHALTLPGLLALLALLWAWRRGKVRRWAQRLRGRRAAVAGAALAACALVPRAARADDFSPYWEQERRAAAGADGDDEVKWHAGIRVGPYIPDIDLQLGLNAITGKGPYEAMFGDYYFEGDDKVKERRVWQVLPFLDVDRVVWSGLGQILVGGSIGYMQKTGYAYLEGTSEDDPMRPRSRSSSTSFKLLPLAATLSYRFTYLDDAVGIPLVPYLKGGLAYYMWWITAPDGEISEVCRNPDPMAPCEPNKGYGGSLGVQASIGLAIRAERIDPDAAQSMRSGGIHHAGFYAEWSWARVDGFGSSKKLSVGDTTWFAGVNFEF